MISPSEVARKAPKFEDENYRFRAWLKAHADEDELDARFRRLHEKLFADYDCRQCANCCREYKTTVQPGEIPAMAASLGENESEFARKYLSEEMGDMVFDAPCPMLLPDGACRVQACKPEECRAFPHTDKPDRLGSMLGMLSFASVCPVVFEILQRLKQMYRFRR